jgi:HEAT repeat protein
MGWDFCLLLIGLISAAGLEPGVGSVAHTTPQVTVDMPAYQGRSLDSWLQDLVCTPCGPAFEPAADAIRAMGATAVPHLLQRIERGPHGDLAVTAIRVLGPLARSAVPELTEFYRIEPSSFSAAMALVYLSAEKPVIEALSSPTQVVRETAVRALGYGGTRVDGAAIPPLIENLEKGSTDTRSRSTVIWALSSIHKREDLVIPALLRLVDDHDAWVRRTAVAGLAGFNLARTSDRIITALGDADDRVRGRAARSLGEGVDRTTDDTLVEGIVAALIVRLNDPVDDVRSQTAWAVGRIGPRAKDAVAALMKLTEDVNPQVRRAATASLAHIKDDTRY